MVIVAFTSLMNTPGSFAQWSGFSYPYSFGAYNYGYGYPYSYQQIGYPFDYPASLFPWPTNLSGVNHPLGAILNWPWNQAFDIINIDTPPDLTDLQGPMSLTTASSSAIFNISGKTSLSEVSALSNSSGVFMRP